MTARAARQIRSRCLQVDIAASLSHVIPVVADQAGAGDALHLGECVDKIRVVVLQADFQIQLDRSLYGAFALDDAPLQPFFQKGRRTFFGGGIRAGKDEDVGIAMGFPVDEREQDHPDEHAADDRQRNHSGGQHDAVGDGPEQEGDIQRLLDGRAEADDGEGADHAQGEDHVGRDCKNHDGGDHGEGHQGRAEAGGIHDPLIGFFIDEENEHSDAEGQNQSQDHVEKADACHILQKTGFENIAESHNEIVPFFFVWQTNCPFCSDNSAVDPAGGIFGECADSAPRKADGVPNDVRKEFAPLHLQNDGRGPGGDGDHLRGEQAGVKQPRPDVKIQRDAHMARRKDEGLPGVIHDGFRAESQISQLDVEFFQKRDAASRHKIRMSLQDAFHLLPRKGDAVLPGKAVYLALLLQADEGGVPVIIANPEFFPDVDPVDFFPEGLVVHGVKIQASDLVRSVRPVGVPASYGREPCPEDQKIGMADFVFPLVPIFHGFTSFQNKNKRLHPFPSGEGA